MKNYNAEDISNHTQAEWASIAEQAASKAKEEFNGHKALPPVYSLLVIGAIVFAILFALASLLFPQTVQYWAGSRSGWLFAHPAVRWVLGLVLTAVGWGLRFWWFDLAAWRSRRETTYRRLK